jgi:hypothetical protein
MDRNLKPTLHSSVQPLAVQPSTFAEDVIPLERAEFEAMLAEMQLSTQVLEATSAVGPFLWWRHISGTASPVFREPL